MELTAAGIETVYPRAIYMSGLESPHRRPVHRGRKPVRLAPRPPGLGREAGPPARPQLPHHLGLLERARRDAGPARRGLLQGPRPGPGAASAASSRTGNARSLLEREEARLAEAGFESLGLKPTHFLLSLRPDGTLVRDADGELALRICNFEMIRRKRADLGSGGVLRRNGCSDKKAIDPPVPDAATFRRQIPAPDRFRGRTGARPPAHQRPDSKEGGKQSDEYCNVRIGRADDQRQAAGLGERSGGHVQARRRCTGATAATSEYQAMAQLMTETGTAMWLNPGKRPNSLFVPLRSGRRGPRRGPHLHLLRKRRGRRPDQQLGRPRGDEGQADASSTTAA